MGTLANNEDPDEMQHNVDHSIYNDAFHLGLHFLLRSKKIQGQKYT